MLKIIAVCCFEINVSSVIFFYNFYFFCPDCSISIKDYVNLSIFKGYANFICVKNYKCYQGTDICATNI